MRPLLKSAVSMSVPAVFIFSLSLYAMHTEQVNNAIFRASRDFVFAAIFLMLLLFGFAATVLVAGRALELLYNALPGGKLAKSVASFAVVGAIFCAINYFDGFFASALDVYPAAVFIYPGVWPWFGVMFNFNNNQTADGKKGWF